jgi:hypothetical protein
MNQQAASSFETLERRVLLSANLPADLVDYLNRLPIESPAPFHHGHLGHTGKGDDAVFVAPEANPSVTTLLNSGPVTNRVDIALVGDGYTTADLPTYAAHASRVVNDFFLQTPLDRYKSYFNVHRVDVVSNQSGVDNDPTQGILRDTAMDMGFWTNGIERLLGVNVSKARGFAAFAPQFEQVLAIANSSKYGGAGYPGSDVGTFSGGNGFSLEVALHEFGHAFADLADEYEYGGPTTYTGGERPETNVTILNATQILSQQRKWWRWMDTPNVDAFEGGYYSVYGVFRPTFDSKMRNLGRPWDEVNSEQLILSLYRTVRPIDSATAAGTYPSTNGFFVDPVDPIGTPLSVQWLLNGQPIAGATSLTFNPATLDLSGTHTLGVRVADTTPMVRDPVAQANLLTQTRSWTILDAIAPRVVASSFGFDQSPQRFSVRFSENVAGSLQAGDLRLQPVGGGAAITPIAASYDPATHTATFTLPGVLPDGQYNATIAAGAIADAAGNALPSVSVPTFFYRGDMNRDATVNNQDIAAFVSGLTDPAAFATSFGYSPLTLGDLSGDGAFNNQDIAPFVARLTGARPSPTALRTAPQQPGLSAVNSFSGRTLRLLEASSDDLPFVAQRVVNAR